MALFVAVSTKKTPQVFEVDVKASAVNNSLLELLQSPVVRVRRLEFGGTLRADAASILSAALKAAPHLGLVHFFSCNFHPHSLQAVLAGIVQSPNIKILELEVNSGLSRAACSI